MKKTTEQSSTDNNDFSSRAVDDNLGPYYDSKSCTHTKQEENPWWRVDLGREYIVTGVWEYSTMCRKVANITIGSDEIMLLISCDELLR